MMRKQGSCLKKEIMQGTMPGARRRGRPRMAWMDNIKTWTGLSVEVNQNDRGQGQMEKVQYVYGVDNSGIVDGQRTEKNYDTCYSDRSVERNTSTG